MDYRKLVLVLGLTACDSDPDLGVVDATTLDVPTDQSRDATFIADTILSDSDAPTPPPAPTCEDLGCADGSVCDDGACWPTGDACDVVLPAQAWRVSAGTYGPLGHDATGRALFPGFDLGGRTDAIDNRFGALADSIDTWLDVRGAFEQGLAGEHVPLLTRTHTAGVERIEGFLGVATARGHRVREASFRPGTAIPRAVIERADRRDAVARANTYYLEFPLGDVWLQFPIMHARLDGELVADGTSHLMLGGVVPVSAVARALNDAGSACDCLDGPLVDAHGRCAAPGTCEGLCHDLELYCPAAVALLTPDIDLDHDGRYAGPADGISVGLALTVEPATLDGLDGCPRP